MPPQKAKNCPKKQVRQPQNAKSKSICLPENRVFSDRDESQVTGKKVNRFTSKKADASGALVEYYDQGTRFGFLKGETPRGIKILPIAAYKQAQPRCVYIPKKDVKILDEQTASRLQSRSV